MAENLVLEVIDGPAEANMSGHKKTFTNVGGSLGRADSNSWVLPDVERIVSSSHADILFSGNSYSLVDKSTNGTFINGSDSPIGAGQQVKLNDGDVFVLGHYHIKATYQAVSMDLPDGLGSVDFLDDSDKTTIGSIAAAAPQPQTNDQFDQWFEPGHTNAAKDVWGQLDGGVDTPLPDVSQTLDPLASFSDPVASVDPLAVNSSYADPLASKVAAVDPLDALTGAGVPSNAWDTGSEQVSATQGASDDWWLSESDNTPAIQQSISIPSPVAESPVVQSPPIQPVQVPQPSIAPEPVAFTSASAIQSESIIAPEPVVKESVAEPLVAPSQVAAGKGSHLSQSLGLEGLDQSGLQLLDQQAAALIRETTSRLMDLLRARSSIKNELRVERTMIQSQDNNPLKFSATVDDALGMMFGAGRGAFLSPSEAIRDSFDNISDHQIAVMFAMRAAYEHMMAQFDPAKLKALFERTNGKGLSLNKKAKNWDSFEEWYTEQKKDQEATYNKLFGELFADAYEKKISELSAVRRMS